MICPNCKSVYHARGLIRCACGRAIWRVRLALAVPPIVIVLLAIFARGIK